MRPSFVNLLVNSQNQLINLLGYKSLYHSQNLIFYYVDCIDAFEEWWDILLLIYYKYTVKSVGEGIMKIGQYLAKLQAKM